jgi:hypothetical protein
MPIQLHWAGGNACPTLGSAEVWWGRRFRLPQFFTETCYFFFGWPFGRDSFSTGGTKS